MSQFKQNILNYGEDVQDLDCSPYEHLRMLHDRTELENNVNELDTIEKQLLIMYDLMLLTNINEMLKHIRKAYDFSLSDDNNIPVEQWWWHLDKVVKGKLQVNVDYNVFMDEVM